jgi:probable F420-dependent oxidoreductase
MALKLGVGLFTGQIPATSKRSYHQEYQDILELTRLVESSGLDAAWVSEHHFAADGYLPSLVVMMAAMAAVTERIELGTGVILAPFHDPLRLAEDFAVCDQIAGGRTICGLGVGWREEEFREFGIPVSSRTRRLTELVEILRLAWSEQRFSYSGRHFRYEDVAVTPKPARTPPLLVGGFVDAAVKRAGRIGDGYISSRASNERVAECFMLASAERAAAGRPGPPIVGVLQNSFVTEDPERDWPLVAAGAGHQLGVYTGWRQGTDIPGVPLEVMPPEETSLRPSIAFGTPEQVTTYLGELIDILSAYPESHLVLRHHYPGMDSDKAALSIELFATEVAPRLRERAARR